MHFCRREVMIIGDPGQEEKTCVRVIRELEVEKRRQVGAKAIVLQRKSAREEAMRKTLRDPRMPGWQSIHLQSSGSGKWQHTADVPDPGLCIYRAVTKAMLLKYFRMSMEVGRLPSLVGRE